jgi:hypothetical protein
MMEKRESPTVYIVKKTQITFFIKVMTDTTGNAVYVVEKSNGEFSDNLKLLFFGSS